MFKAAGTESTVHHMSVNGSDCLIKVKLFLSRVFPSAVLSEVVSLYKCSVLFFQLSQNSLPGYGFCNACLVPAETSRHPALGW